MVADELDRAQELTETMTALKINEVKNKSRFNINNESGLCIECGNQVEPVMLDSRIIIPRWCSKECRDAWEMDN